MLLNIENKWNYLWQTINKNYETLAFCFILVGLTIYGSIQFFGLLNQRTLMMIPFIVQVIRNVLRSFNVEKYVLFLNYAYLNTRYWLIIILKYLMVIPTIIGFLTLLNQEIDYDYLITLLIISVFIKVWDFLILYYKIGYSHKLKRIMYRFMLSATILFINYSVFYIIIYFCLYSLLIIISEKINVKIQFSKPFNLNYKWLIILNGIILLSTIYYPLAVDYYLWINLLFGFNPLYEYLNRNKHLNHLDMHRNIILINNLMIFIIAIFYKIINVEFSGYLAICYFNVLIYIFNDFDFSYNIKSIISVFLCLLSIYLQNYQVNYLVYLMIATYFLLINLRLINYQTLILLRDVGIFLLIGFFIPGLNREIPIIYGFIIIVHEFIHILIYENCCNDSTYQYKRLFSFRFKYLKVLNKQNQYLFFFAPTLISMILFITTSNIYSQILIAAQIINLLPINGTDYDTYRRINAKTDNFNL